MQKWLDSIRRWSYYRGSSLLAPVINLLVFQLVVLAAAYLWFVQRTKIPLLSLILSLIIITLLTLAVLLQERKSFKIKKAEKRRRIGRDYLKNKIKQLNQDEFKWQVAQLLLKIKGINDIQDQEYFLGTILHGRKTAVGIYHADYEDEVPPPTLAEFLNQAALEGYTQALFITSGTYTDKCRALADKKSSMKIQLMDLEDMLDYMEQTGLFPDENTIDRLIDREISSGNKKLQLIKKHLLMPKRIRTYLVYSLLFLVLSRIFGNMLIYYTLVSVFFLAMAVFTWLFNYKNQDRPGKSKSLLDPPSAGSRQGS